MSSSSRTPSGLPPSVIVLGITLVLIAVLALLGVSLFTGAWNNWAPVQTGAQALQQVTESAPDASPTSDETIVPAVQDTIEPTYEYTWIVDDSTPIPTFDISFVPTIAPLDDWETYTDDLEGISIQYPQGWVIKELPLEVRQTARGYTTNIGTYDSEDPVIMNLPNGPIPPQLFKIELNIDRPVSSSLPIPPGQSLEDWARAHKFHPEGGHWVSEEYITIAGSEGYRRVWQDPNGVLGVNVMLPKGDVMFYFFYLLRPESPFAETADQIIQSFQFTR